MRKVTRRITSLAREVAYGIRKALGLAKAGWFGSEEQRGSHLRLGKRGEKTARRHLRRCGYKIVARNIRTGGVEVDLIARDGEALVFIEVKTRRSQRTGKPEEAVDARKQYRLRRAAEAYMARYRRDGVPIRFDIVAIIEEGAQRRIEIFKDAF